MTKTEPILASHSRPFFLRVLPALLIVFISHSTRVQAAAVPSAADASPSQTSTLTTTVRRVSVDVVVTDLKGRSVTGLTQEDFSVEEDSVPQPIKSFDSHTGALDKSYVSPKVPSLPPNTFLNVPKTLESGTPTVILYDALNTSFVLQAYAEQQFLKFIKRRRTDSPVAIFVLSDRLHLVQAFTEPLSAQEVQKALEYFAGAGRWRHPRSRDRRVAVTLTALTGIGRFLASMPGRKNLIWYSSGFPESILPHETGGRSSDMFAPPNYSEAIRQATDLLNLSHVAIYPVDVRGVRADPTYSAALPGAVGIDSGTGPLILLAMRGAFIELDTAVRATMNTLADDTGGHAYYGTNDLEKALGEAIVNGSNYYSLTYEPTNPKYDGSLRHIKVTLDKRGYNLSYRRTYFADDLNAVARAAADAPESPLLPSLERGTPLSYGLIVEAHLDASGPPAPATPAQLRVLSEYEAMQPRDDKTAVEQAGPVMMQTYLISYGLISRQLEMPANPAGDRQALLEFGVIAYDDDGRKLNGTDARVEDTIHAARYAKVESDGYHVAQEVAIPVTASLIRVAVRDVRSNRVGSLEVMLPLANDGTPNSPDLTQHR